MGTAESPNSPVSPLVSSPTDLLCFTNISASGTEGQQARGSSLLSQLTTTFENAPQLADIEFQWPLRSAGLSSPQAFETNEEAHWVDRMCHSPMAMSEAKHNIKSSWSGKMVTLPLRNDPTRPRGSDSTITIRQPSPNLRNRANLSIQKQSSPRRSNSPRPSKYHLITTTTTTNKPRHHANQAALAQVLQNLESPLAPLVNVVTGLPHPEFPRNLLQYYVLTHEQLDSLARWYHQVNPPVEETWCYPCWVPAWTSLNPDDDTDVVDLATKKRRWGRFIGLRGCESPTDGAEGEDGTKDLRTRMERQWRNALQSAYEEHCLREKGWMGRF